MNEKLTRSVSSKSHEHLMLTLAKLPAKKLITKPSSHASRNCFSDDRSTIISGICSPSLGARMVWYESRAGCSRSRSMMSNKHCMRTSVLKVTFFGILWREHQKTLPKNRVLINPVFKFLLYSGYEYVLHDSPVRAQFQCEFLESSRPWKEI